MYSFQYQLLPKLFFVLFVLLVGKALSKSKKDIDIVLLQEVSDVDQSDNLFSRRKFQQEQLSLVDHPDILQYAFTAHKRKFDLRLRRNDRIRPAEVPTVYLGAESDVESMSNLGGRELKTFALYQDLDNRAAIAVTRDYNEKGPNKKLEGTFADENWTYELKNLQGDMYMVARQSNKDTTYSDENDDNSQNTTHDSEYYMQKRSISGEVNIKEQIRNILSTDTTFSEADLTALLRNLKPHLNDDIKEEDKATKTSENFQKKLIPSNEYIDAGVELLVMIDSTLWNKFKDKNDGDEDMADVELKKYFSLIVNGIDLRYQNIQDPGINIYVTLAGFVIAKSSWSTPWYVNSLVKTKIGDRDQVNIKKALEQFGTYLKQSHNFPEYDHAMSFTDKDLVSVKNDGTINDSPVGQAWVNAICQGENRSSVVEAHGGFISISTAAHELGHNLGAFHDGSWGTDFDNTACPASQNYIMAPQTMSSNLQNRFAFSQCSVNQFKKALQTACCLSNLASHQDPTAFESHTQHLPGQLYTIEQQCKDLYGTGSRPCLDSTRPSSTSFCQVLKCVDPKDNLCWNRYTAPARGTDCTTGNWCIEGKCVTKISTFNEGKQAQKSMWCAHSKDCPKPDSQFVSVGDSGWMSCPDLVTQRPSLCDRSDFRDLCCVSCWYLRKQTSTNVPTETPVDGAWSVWSRWSTCSATCGPGAQTRSRTCTNPNPSNGGRTCSGDSSQVKNCDWGNCVTSPEEGSWGIWTQWTVCSSTCGPGVKIRTRYCGGGTCRTGEDRQTTACQDRTCPGVPVTNWSSWRTTERTPGTSGTASSEISILIIVSSLIGSLIMCIFIK